MKHLTSVLYLILFTALTPLILIGQGRNLQEHFPDDPSAREEYEFMRLRDPLTGLIPPMIAQQESEFAAKLPKRNPFARSTYGAPVDQWQSMGPTNQSGRIQAFGIDVKNSSNFLAGAASGGVWRTVDEGLSWVRVTLPNDEQAISAIVQDTRPGKESTWYYSTGELLSTTARRVTSDIRTHTWGNGIYKSTDNGASWNPLSATVTTHSYTAPINFSAIWNLAIDTRNLAKDILYAACYGGIMRSSDGGTSWTNVLGGGSAQCFNSEIVIGSGGTLYAAIGSAYDGTSPPQFGIWRSTDGIQWTKISDSQLPTSIRRTRLALSRSTDTTLYCFTESPTDWKNVDTEFYTNSSLLRYTYGSGDGAGPRGSWVTRIVPFSHDPTAYYGSLGGYALTLAVHPKNAEQVFVGGTNLYYSTDGFRTTSGFTHIGGYPYNMQAGSLHPDMHGVVFSPTDDYTLYVCTDGGVYTTADFSLGDGNWISYNNGLTSAQVYHSSLNRAADGDDLIVSGLQDNSSYATNSPSSFDPWEVISGGDGMTTAIAATGGLIFSSYQSGSIVCSNYDGASITFQGYMSPPTAGSVYNFFTNYILEPNEGLQFYEAATDHLWRNDNPPDLSNSNWTEITGISNFLTPAQAFISSFGFATDVRDRLFVGSSNGKVFSVDHAAGDSPTVKDISSPSFPSNGFVAGVEVDPMNAGEIIAVFSNYNVQSLFRTTDGGTSWDAIGGNLESLPNGTLQGPSVRCAKILHTKNGTIYYVGTSVGLYSTTKIDGANTIWVQESPTLIGNLIVESLDARQSDGRVIVSTQGGGVFKNVPLNSVNNPVTTSGGLQLEQNFPNPFSTHSTLRFTMTTREDVHADLYDALGVKISQLMSATFEAGIHTIELDATNLAPGNYFLRMQCGKAIATKMLTVVK